MKKWNKGLNCTDGLQSISEVSIWSPIYKSRLLHPQRLPSVFKWSPSLTSSAFTVKCRGIFGTLSLNNNHPTKLHVQPQNPKPPFKQQQSRIPNQRNINRQIHLSKFEGQSIKPFFVNKIKALDFDKTEQLWRLRFGLHRNTPHLTGEHKQSQTRGPFKYRL